jgi:hypothetical protein
MVGEPSCRNGVGGSLRLVQQGRDYGNGNVQLAYEYGYSGDGARVWKRDYLVQQEYRYQCRIGCGGVPMRVYSSVMGSESWRSIEDYLPAGRALLFDWRNWLDLPRARPVCPIMPY